MPSFHLRVIQRNPPPQITSSDLLGNQLHFSNVSFILNHILLRILGQNAKEVKFPFIDIYRDGWLCPSFCKIKESSSIKIVVLTLLFDNKESWKVMEKLPSLFVYIGGVGIPCFYVRLFGWTSAIHVTSLSVWHLSYDFSLNE